MTKEITIMDEAYIKWVKEIAARYRMFQVKASVRVNHEMLQFYWDLGHDIVLRQAENKYGRRFYSSVSHDLRALLPNTEGLSERNIRYCKDFYLLYSSAVRTLPQPVARSEEERATDGNAENLPQVVAESQTDAEIIDKLCCVPWGHHRLIIDRCKGNVGKAWFFVNKVVEDGWSRSVLLNFIDTNLYERQGNATTNFKQILPATDSELAQEITRDPYCFDFTKLREPYNERLLKDALLHNIEKFLLELGTGFAYLGREYRVEVGDTEQFIDMLFYNLKLRCYVVVEVKTTEFSSSHIGQLGAYVVAVDHQLRTAQDNKTIGLLICKTKDRVVAQYALESSSQPIGISEYELEKFYPEKLEGTIPTVAELEATLGNSK